MEGTLWVLGSSGWMPRAGQETSCFLLEAHGDRGSELVMLDAGTGTSNLAMVKEVLARHDRMHVLLSHYHLDHTVGLMYLKRFCANKRVDVWGPGVPAYPRRTESYVRDLLQDAAYSSGPTGFAREVAYHDYGGEDFEVGGIPVRVRPQRHSSPSFELRVGDLVTYATDTSFDPAAWRDSPQSHLLLHECWQLSDGDARHTSLEALAKGLPRDRFRKIVLVHQNPAWSADERYAVSGLAAANGMSLAHDGMHLELRLRRKNTH